MKLFIIILTFFSINIFATNSIKIKNFSTLTTLSAVGGTGNFNLVFEKGSSETSTEETSSNIYLPMWNSSTINSQYFYYSKDGASPLNATSTVSTNNFTIPLTVTIDNSGTTYYAVIAVKKTSGSYYIAGSINLGSNVLTSSDVSFTVSVADVCSTLADVCNDGAEIDTTNRYAYLYLSTSNITGQITPSTYPNGIYLNLKFKNKIDSTVTIDNQKGLPGDGRIIVSYSANTNVPDQKSTIVIFTSDGPGTGVGVVSRDAEDFDLKTTSLTNTATAAGLRNGITYNYGIVFLDKYGFATPLSNNQSAEALEIEQLLKKKSCYLLTAGFGQEHYVIEYFRAYRDHVLVKYYLGQKFIDFYYSTAPKYALIIYKHESIRAIIRGMAYVLYFVFNYYGIFFICLLIVSIVIFRKNKKQLNRN